MSTTGIHRRSKSKEDVAFPSITPIPTSPTITLNDDEEPTVATQNGFGHTPQERFRFHSSPSQPSLNGVTTKISYPTSPSAVQASLPSSATFPSSSHSHTNGINGHGSHNRVRSISSHSFTPPSPSPLASSTPLLSPSSSDFQFPQSSTDISTVDSSPPTHGRRHSRIHSRNLSIYFPRPGTLQSAAIAEDGVQEVDVEESSDGTPVEDIPVTSPRIRLSSAPVGKRLGEGFQFGGRPPGSSSPSSKQNGNAGPTRRGHHHKHSLSHNFFSFLDPTATAAPSTSSTGPTSAPPEPWEAITPFSPSASSKQTNFIQTQQVTHPLSLPSPSAEEPISRPAIVAGSLQFVLGAWLWVSGQQNGSLSCTGLGYWIVFDALGILLIKVLPQYLALPSSQTSARSYGNARVDAVAFFSQCVYLLFASVYICKETVEHLLLSVGNDQDGGGHHHHHSEEATAINFPIFLISLSLLSLIGSSYLFDNHAKLVDATGRHIVYPRIDIHALFRPSQTPHVVLSRSLTSNPWKTLLTNPFSATPLLFAVSLVLVAGLVPPSQHHHMDVILATLQTVMTFSIAYPAAVALGRVLLQTAPPRGIVGARLEAFLRVMRELERHPDVLHLPPPHMWQLTPSSHSHSQYIHTNKLPTESLVVTMELHVRKEMDDASVLRITRWAWETVTHALGGSGACEVTVGIVRG